MPLVTGATDDRAAGAELRGSGGGRLLAWGKGGGGADRGSGGMLDGCPLGGGRRQAARSTRRRRPRMCLARRRRGRREAAGLRLTRARPPGGRTTGVAARTRDPPEATRGRAPQKDTACVQPP